MARTAIINRRRTRLLRKTVSPGENLLVAALGVALLALVMWVVVTDGTVDPGLRDLPEALLDTEREKLTLYVPPLARWQDPSTPAAVAAAPSLDPFPAALLAGDWTLLGRVRAFDAGNLYEKINGEAEKFLKQGFVSMHYAALRHPESGDELAIELYDQGAMAGSSGVFAAHGAAARETREREGVIYFRTAIGVVGRADRYFFRAAGNRETPRIDAKSDQLVALMAGRVPRREGAAGPVGLRALSAFGIAESAVEFKQENAFQIDAADGFWFGDLEGDGRIFVHAAESPAAAETLLAQLLEEQGYEHQPVPGERRWRLLRHRVLGSLFAVARLGSTIYGLDRVNESGLAESIMERLGGIVRDEEG